MGSLEKPINYVADFKALKASVPSIGVLPFNQESGIVPGFSDKLRTKFIDEFIVKKMFRPFSAAKWLGSVYKYRKANSVNRLLELIRENYVPLDYLIDGNVFRVGNKFGFRVAIYSVKEPNRSTYYFRIVKKYSNFENAILSIVSEINLRYNRREFLPFVPKSFFINPPLIHFYLYSTMNNGDFAFSPVPFLEIHKIDYLKSDDYFQDLIAYWFHFMRIANVDFCDAPLYVRNKRSIYHRDDYIINSSFKITKKLCLASFSVISGETGNEVQSFTLPFHSFKMDKINEILREATRIILFSTLSDSARRRVGIVDTLKTNTWFTRHRSFFVDGYYAGSAETDLVLPVGTHEIFEMRKNGVVARTPTGGFVILPYSNPLYEKNVSELRYFNYLSQH